MKEVITMWKNTRMIILVALTAAIYAAGLIAFKGGIVLIPGITEVRPANVFPIIFGLMFGPAGAWGAAIGNAIGDIFGGTLGPGSIFGFLGNFFLGFVPYKMWGSTFGLVPASDMSQTTNSWRKFIAYLIITITSAAACAIIIAWYLDLAGIIPFAALGIIITINNAAAEIILGPPLLLLLYPRVKRWGLIWTDIMDRSEVSAGFNRQLGAILMIVGALGGLIVGLGISTGLYAQQLFTFGQGNIGQVGVWLGVLPFLILIIVASFMLSGREQFVEEEEEIVAPVNRPVVS
jgi:energy-coupling factor transport system substrate-specific component